jgi:hypothetical protein
MSRILDITDIVGLLGEAPTAPFDGTVWSETFEAAGYDNVWSVGEVINITSGTPPVLNPDASPPIGAPAGWGDECWGFSFVGGGDGGVNGHIRHNGLVVPPDKIFDVTFEFRVTVEEFVNGNQLGLLRLLFDDGGITRFLFVSNIRQQNTGEFTCEVTVRASGSGAGTPVTFAPVITLDTNYLLHFVWDQLNKTYLVELNAVELGSGAISGDPADNEWVFDQLFVGPVNNAGSVGALIYFVDNILIQGQ